MNLPWFRFYDEVVDDPKVQKLPDRLFKSWVNFMCIANKNTSNRGALPPIDDVAYRLHCTTSKAESVLAELVKAGLFEWRDGVAYCHNWNNRQFQSDSSTARVHKFRQAHRNVSETLHETFRNAESETDQSRTEQSRTEEPPLPPSGPATVSEADFSYSAEFESFWVDYPKKTGKGAAYKAWKKLRPSQSLQSAISSAIAKQKRSRQWLNENGRYIPNPATWLNERRWDDDGTQPQLTAVSPEFPSI